LHCSKESLKDLRVNLLSAETYTAEEIKMAAPPPPTKGNVCVEVLCERKPITLVKRIYRRQCGEQESGRQSIKRRLEQAMSYIRRAQTGLSMQADTGEIVREAFQCSPSKYTLSASKELRVPLATLQNMLHPRL
jgi:hypothetical protein